VLFPALPYHFLANPTGRPFRHPLSRATLPLRPASGGLASPPFQSGVRQKKSLRGFFLYRRFAMQISGLLSRPSMGSVIQIKNEKSMDFSWVLQNRFAILHAAKSPSMGLLLFGKKAVKKQTLCHCRVVGEPVEPRLVSLSNHDPTIFFRIAHSPPLSRHAEFISASVPVCVQDLQMWHSYKGSDTRSSANLPFNLHAKLYLFYYQTENAVHHKQGNQ